MPTTVHQQQARTRTNDRLAAFAEDIAYLVVLFSGAVLVVAIVVAAFVS